MEIDQPLYVRFRQSKISDPDHERDYKAVNENQTKYDMNIFEGISCTVYEVDSISEIGDLHLVHVKARVLHPAPPSPSKVF